MHLFDDDDFAGGGNGVRMSYAGRGEALMAGEGGGRREGKTSFRVNPEPCLYQHRLNL